MVFSSSTGQKADGSTVFQGETTSWNIADGFTKINVLKILIEINLYEEMAKFGGRNGEEVIPSEIPYKRVEGFDRLMFSLRQIISNCMFQIEREDKDKIKALVERIDLVESFSDGICDITKNDVTKESELKINDIHFRKLLDILTNIKEELHFILNRAGLIFRKGEETDLDEFMKSVYEG
jgi:hypothetical protein